ncbi:SRPBCC family protein [Rossellomorea yichunensis]|uniref:SRPBCC family protein n=1 Tax=Rossellomorea yichunensis TaxID=3077331 RepID=UPI0028DD4899|nr:SRPBCC family protein [Rossellomorea sp. YC4-1]MDT9026853.1 SRPBCC family protein [Rossellomorea sp. YC4-1]
MPTIRHITHINAPVSLCFDLARNVEIHTQTTSRTKERAVGGVTSGLLEVGDAVTWEAVHFGVKQRLTAQIVEMDTPHSFTDVMVKGAFKSFTHVHEFHEHENGTLMKDTFTYKAPFGLLGNLADILFLKRYMYTFIEMRANELKNIAEQKNTPII